MYLIERNLKKRFVPELLLIAVCAFTFFVHNGLLFSDIMESRNLVTAHEMVQDGNWLFPTLNGEPRYAKPPLPTWVAAAVESVAGDNISLQRSMAGLMATLLVMLLYYFALRQTKSRNVGVAAGVVLATSVNAILMSRTATWDIYCHAFMLGAILSFVYAYERSGRNYGYFLLAGLLMGLSFLSKGPVSFWALLFPFLIAYFLVFGKSRKENPSESKTLPVVLMTLVALLTSFWWEAVIFFSDGRDELFAVGKKESGAWMGHSVRPWWYYWRFFLESGVWCVFVVTALFSFYWKRYVAHRKQYVFSVVWCLFVLLFLSLIPEKKTRYLLPILVPSALMVGHLLYFWWNCAKNHYFPEKTLRWWNLNAWLLGVVVALSPVAMYVAVFRQGMMPAAMFGWMSVLLVLMGLSFMRCAARNDVWGFCGSVVTLLIIVVTFLMPSLTRLFSNPDRNSINAVTQMRELDNVPFFHDKAEDVRIEIVYEARRKILPCAFSDTLPAAPFAVVHVAPIGEIIPAEKLRNLQVTEIGTFDDNPRPSKNKLHNSGFVKTVTLIEKKAD